MKKHISYPSIHDFRNIITNINREYSFVGLDDNGEAIYDQSKPKPILKFKGTIKLHGTNAGVSYNKIDGIWAQSRENIITPESDNAGFAFFVKCKQDIFISLIEELSITNNIDLSENTITLYMEWVGKGIQKNVAISNIEKSAFIFGAKITPRPKDENDKPLAYWVDSSLVKSSENNIYNIEDYKMYFIDIDFSIPQLSQNKIIEMTIEVENECPVGKAFGYEGIGEGLVFSHVFENGKVYRFKSKGERHAGKSKVKTLKEVDDVKIRLVMEIAEKVTPIWRLSQMLEQACDFMNGGTLDRSKLGDYIRLVINDVIKEEIDILTDAGLEPKDVNKYISNIAKDYFFEQEKF